MGIEPAGDGCHHRRKDRGDRAADHQSEHQLKCDQRCREAGQRQACCQHDRPGQHHRQRPKPVGQGAPDHAGARHRKEADRHGAGYAGHRPAGIPRDRLQKHRQRKHAADRDTAKQAPGRDDHPAIARIFHLWSPLEISLGARRTGWAKSYISTTIPPHFFASERQGSKTLPLPLPSERSARLDLGLI